VADRKRHIAVDVLGLLLTVLVTAASVQDRDAARPLLWNLRKAFPSVGLAWADGIYAGQLVTWAASALKLTVEIVRRPGDLHTFQVLPRRWVVERTLAWITRHRRTVRDYERLTTPRDHHLLGHDHYHEPPPGTALRARPRVRTDAGAGTALSVTRPRCWPHRYVQSAPAWPARGPGGREPDLL